jgi:hypothetical protein
MSTVASNDPRILTVEVTDGLFGFACASGGGSPRACGPATA